MVKTKFSSAVLFVATVGLVGCHDGLTVDPYPRNWVIDNFESLNGVPLDRSFERWGCRPLDEEHAMNSCEIAQDTDSASGHGGVLHLGATLYPMPREGDDTFTRSQVATYLRGGRLLDLTPYSSFSFSWKLVLKTPHAADSLMSPHLLYLKAELSCTTARSPDAAVPEQPFVVCPIVSTIEPDQIWQNSNSDINNSCRNPEFSTSNSENGEWEQECFTHVDGIRITLDSNKAVQSNHSVEFDLYVDNVELVPAAPR
jgi:hypothetical protein